MELFFDCFGTLCFLRKRPAEWENFFCDKSPSEIFDIKSKLNLGKLSLSDLWYLNTNSSIYSWSAMIKELTDGIVFPNSIRSAVEEFSFLYRTIIISNAPKEFAYKVRELFRDINVTLMFSCDFGILKQTNEFIETTGLSCLGLDVKRLFFGDNTYIDEQLSSNLRARYVNATWGEDGEVFYQIVKNNISRYMNESG